MDKHTMSGKLMHKASDHNTKRCEVEKYLHIIQELENKDIDIVMRSLSELS